MKFAQLTYRVGSGLAQSTVWAIVGAEHKSKRSFRVCDQHGKPLLGSGNLGFLHLDTRQILRSSPAVLTEGCLTVQSKGLQPAEQSVPS